MLIQEIEDKHWPNILKIQDESYQDFGAEELDVLKSKYEASPNTCFVCSSSNGELLGYLLAHPWSGTFPPKLFEPLPNIEQGEYLYLHDMAISPQSKGKGIGRMMASKLFGVAQNKGINRVILVAVQGSESFWSKVGFHEVNWGDECSSYGESAILMEKVLPL